MKKLQSSTTAKVCAWIILLCASFAACVFGVRAVLAAQSMFSDSWQGDSRYYIAVENRRRELVNAVEMVQRLRALEEQIEAGTANAAAQADAEALQENREEVSQRFSPQNTWFRFRLMDADTGEVLGSNLEEGESLLRAVTDIRRTAFELGERDGEWSVYNPYDESYDGWYETGSATSADPNREEDGEDQPLQPLKLVLEYGVPEMTDESIPDEFCLIRRAYQEDRANFDQYLTGFLNLTALTFIALIWILWTAGHKKGEEKIALTWQEHIFFDLYAAAMIAAGIVCAAAAIWAAEMTYRHSNQQFYWTAQGNYGPEVYEPMGVWGAAALCAAAVLAAALLLRTFAVRIKAGSLAKSTLLCRVAAWTVQTVHEFVRFLPLTWKAVLASVGYVFLSLWLFMMGRYDGIFMLIYWWLQLVLVLTGAWWTLHYSRLRRGTKTIAKGDLEYQIDTRHMPWDLRRQAEDLNNISAGLSSAVDERIKSERFKAELITNVSHDLKTPLTSIINYVNLLKSTEQTDPKAIDYIEVLERKSQRLKKLTEDLVEASKASTGVLAVTREKIGMSQLIDQALGEWEERLAAQRLTLVTTLPEGETWVYADGRHLWRVIDNLLSNCSKYAMEGTRVYLDLERGKGQVTLSVKNISREALNVPADRLMERFVRGEESRSTEGSGLGLSIARSLTELQGGAFELAVDGDLFKAIVTLPQAN